MRPQTFLIKSENPYLLKALVEDLVKAGYKSSWGKPYKYCKSISSNVHNNMTSPRYKKDWKLFMSNGTNDKNSEFDITFNLPQDYSQAFDFAVKQLEIVNDIIEIEEKVGHLVNTKVYWSNNDVYPKGFIWRFKEIKHAAYVNIYSICDIDNCCFEKDTGLNNMAWDNIREATPEKIKWLEACEKANKYIPLEEVNKPQFEVGKWYKYDDWYIKYAKHRNGVWVSSEEINAEGKYLKASSTFGAYTDDAKILLTDLSEIQQYLPDGHEDKTIKYTLEEGEYYKVVEDDFWMIGKVSKGNNGDNDGLLLRGECSYSIDSDGAYNVDDEWCYYDEEDGRVVRNFTKLFEDSDEVKWLEACHKAGKYLTKEEALNPKSTIKVGDVVVVTERYKNNSAIEGMLCTVDKIDTSTIPYLVTDTYNLYTWGVNWCKNVRLATQEEIKDVLLNEARKRYPLGCSYEGLDFISGAPTGNVWTSSEIKPYWYNNRAIALQSGQGLVYVCGKWAKIVETKSETKTAKFGDVVFTIKKGEDYASTIYGKVTKNDIVKAIEYIKNPPKLLTYPLNIHVGDKHEFIYTNDNSIFKIGFGCKSGTLQELENILKCFS